MLRTRCPQPSLQRYTSLAGRTHGIDQAKICKSLDLIDLDRQLRFVLRLHWLGAACAILGEPPPETPDRVPHFTLLLHRTDPGPRTPVSSPVDFLFGQETQLWRS